jgi:hypothetical protein
MHNIRNNSVFLTFYFERVVDLSKLNDVLKLNLYPSEVFIF